MVLACALAALLTSTPENRAAEVLRLADFLLADGDHYRAIGEYKRFLFLAPDSPDAVHARFGIGHAYRRGGQYRAAWERYSDLARALPRPRSAEARVWAEQARYQGGEYPLVERALDRWLASDADGAPPELRSRAAYLLGWARLQQADDGGAEEAFVRAGVFPSHESLISKTRALRDLPRRSPVVAGLLAIVPGAGHVYIGQPLTGLMALGWNGLFGVALYDSIHRRQWGLVALLGSLQSVWYFGNIFGAVSGAQKLNRDVRRNALEALRSEFTDAPEVWPPGG